MVETHAIGSGALPCRSECGRTRDVGSSSGRTFMIHRANPKAFPILFARSISFCARSTTGGSIIFEPADSPRPGPRCCASANRGYNLRRFLNLRIRRCECPVNHRNSAWDVRIPSLQIREPANFPPRFATRPCRLHRRKPNRWPALPPPSPHSPAAYARTTTRRLLRSVLATPMSDV